MNASLVPTAVLSLFLVCIILGFLSGWIRGFSKSLVRFIIVLAVAVLAFFVVPAITTAVLKMDISKLNININGVQAVTFGDLIIDLLENIPVVQDLIGSSPTFESVITLAPQMIANVVLFIVFFFVFKYVSMAIYWIITGIFFSKKKMGDKERHKFIGAVIGAVQGVLVSIVVMVPIFGIIETTRPLIAVAKTEESQSSTETESSFDFDNPVYNVTEMGTSETPTQGSESETSTETPTETPENNLEKILTESELYFNAFDNTWIIKVYKALKIKDLSLTMFDNLTTAKDRDLEVNLRKEVEVFANAYPGLSGLINGKADTEDPETYESLKESFNTLYKSPVLSGIISELVPKIANRWTDETIPEEERTFCGIPKINFGDESLDRVFDALLLNLRTQTEKEQIQKDVTTSIDVMQVCASSGVVSALKGKENIVDVLLLEKNKNLVSSIIDIARQSTTLLDCLPDIMNLAMVKVYDILNIKDAPSITLTSDQVNWDTEKATLQNIVNNILKLYKQIDTGTKQPVDPEQPEGAKKTALDCLDFALLGKVFDGLRESQLLKAGSKDIISKLLESDIIVGEETTVLQTFKDKIKDVWDNTEVKMETTFVALQDALKLAKELKNNTTGNITKENIGNIVSGLKENPALKDTVNEVLNDPETMKGLGLDDKTAGVVKDTIGAVINGSYEGDETQQSEAQAKDIEAITEIYGVASEVLSASSENKANLDKDTTDKLIETIADSSVIKDNLTSGTSSVSGLDFGGNLDDTTKENIASKISEIDDTKLSEEEKANLKALFGIA